MANYIGEYDCKLDDKGRLSLPSGLRKQLPPEALGGAMVVNRGFDQCLALFTRTEWENELERFSHLNAFSRKERKFMRLFANGATEVKVDGNGRLLLPKKLIDYAGIDAEVVVYAYGKKIEIWAKSIYDEVMELDSDEFAELAEEVMVDKQNKESDE